MDAATNKKYLWNAVLKDKKIRNNVAVIVAVRTISTIFVFITANVMLMSTLMKPWKREYLDGKKNYLELSFWTLCRVTKKEEICHSNDLDGAPAWFQTFRVFIVLSYILMYCAFFFLLYTLFTTRAGVTTNFLVPSLASLAAAVLSLTALVMMFGYTDLEFLDDARMYRMGWVPDLDTEEEMGSAWRMAWCAFGMMLLSFIICLYAFIKDKGFTSQFSSHCKKIKAQKLMANID